MSLLRIAASTSLALGLALAPVQAAPNGPKAPSTKTSTSKAPKAPKTTTVAKVDKAPKVTTAKSPKAANAKSPKVTSAKSPKSTSTASTLTTTSSSSTPTSTTSETSSTSGTSSTTTATTTTIDYTKGKVAEHLAKNANLRTKLETRLQAAGYEGTVYQAAYGFRNQGQFIAATNVSQHLTIPFEQLKAYMTGVAVDADGVLWSATVGTDGKLTLVAPEDVTTPVQTKSLGQAIKTARSDVDATAAALTATQQADAELAATSR